MPLAVSVEDHEGVDAVEEGAAIDAFVEVEADGDGVDDEPDPPLLDVLAGEHPEADDGEGGGEGVETGDVAVGEADEDEGEGCPEDEGDGGKGEIELGGSGGDGQLAPLGSFALTMTKPVEEAVDACEEVVDFHTAVGIESFVEEDKDVDEGHDGAYDPHPCVLADLENEVEEAEGGAEKIEEIYHLIIYYLIIYDLPFTIYHFLRSSWCSGEQARSPI